MGNLGGTYTTGTISVSANGTAVDGAGTLWSAIAVQGDWILANGNIGLIGSVNDDTDLTLGAPWTGGDLESAPYVLLKMSWLRYNPALTQQVVRDLVAGLEAAGTFVFVSGTTPDPGIGSDGQWAFKVNALPWQLWFKSGGIWVSQPSPLGSFTGTSTTSLAIGTGAKTFATQAGLLYVVGTRARASSNANPSTDWMEGVVTAYAGTSLTVNVDAVAGSGTFADWNLSVAGSQGVAGPTGPQSWATPPVAWSTGQNYTATPPASVVTFGGETYVCTTTHTSGATFDGTKFTKIAAKGSDGTGSGTVQGPTTTTVGHVALWNSTNGTVLEDGGALGNASSKSVGTTSGTVAAGDDSRITGAVQKASNLSDLGNASTARSNLGVGDNWQNHNAELSSGVDLNTLFTAGQYGINNAANGPTTTDTWLHLEIIDQGNPSSSADTVQIATELTLATGYRWIRTCVSGTWKAWRKMVTLDSSGKLPAVDGSQLTNLPGAALRGYIGGLTLSNDASSPNTVLDISAGVCTSDDGTTTLNFASAFTKNCNGAFLASSGDGALDTGSGLTANSWYHVFAIGGATTDYLVSLSATAPTLPSGYTKKRRIGSFKTDGSSHILPFKQIGETFYLGTQVLDINSTTIGTTASLLALGSVPTGVKVQPLYRAFFPPATGGGTDSIILTSPDETDVAPITAGNSGFSSAPGYDMGFGSAGAAMDAATTSPLITNTSAQIRARSNAASQPLQFVTRGWTDWRGRFD
jgi:hypothetical protein